MNKFTEIINSINSLQHLPEFFDCLTEITESYQRLIDIKVKKNNGIYYTTPKLAYFLIQDFFSYNTSRLENIENELILEPCVGIGNFIFALFKYLIDSNKKINFSKIINNIYVVDNDSNALKIYWALLNKLSQLLTNIKLDNSYFNNHLSSRGLLFDKNVESYIKLNDLFKINKFDIIITNPPYKNLKAEKNKFESIDEFEKARNNNINISKLVKSNFSFASSGVLNLYKLFVEKIFTEYSTPTASILLLVPTTVLSDSSCDKLRTCYFLYSNTQKINIFKENNNYFDGTQGLCSIITSKGKETNFIDVNFSCTMNKEQNIKTINYKKLIQLTGDNKLLNLTELELDRYQQLLKFKKIKDIDYIHNLRGELDLTSNKDFIVSIPTDYPLIRGRDIKRFCIVNVSAPTQEYVKKEFLNTCHKNYFIGVDRIACQQISNLNKKQRLNFAYVTKNSILGNSCNFISVDNNTDHIDLFYLLGILNSNLINWFFSIGSSNNHVSNKEIDNIPIPTEPQSKIHKISLLVKEIIHNKADEKKQIQLENQVLDIYGFSLLKPEKTINNSYNFLDKLTTDLRKLLKCNIKSDDALKLLESNKNSSYQLILKNKYPDDKFTQEVLSNLIDKYYLIANDYVLNNISYKLSDLDLEMIKSVPQGGNWKNIPTETVKKSKRLLTVTQKGGRTTLYGRIKYDEPCYTITTYFNRPGNGTYVHPHKNRCITVREAARIQSFRDSYYFVGSKTDFLKQIGNAVPPLFAKAIVNNIKKYVNLNTSIDLFAGAGGLTDGIFQAGVKTLVAVDFEYKACLTLKTNHPEINVICGDLTKQDVKNSIYIAVKGKEIDLLAGGPPCQGFSMAGFRNPNDPRNKLFLEYVDVLSKIKPKVFIMENVEGMKTLEKGQIYAEIINQLSNCGYNVKGKLLFASDYGVPQKRKRLITIGVRKDLQIDVDNLFPEKLDIKVTAKDAIFDLESLQENTESKNNQKLFSDYVKSLRDF